MVRFNLSLDEVGNCESLPQFGIYKKTFIWKIQTARQVYSK